MLKNETALSGGQFEQSSNGFQKLVLQFWVSFQVRGLAILTFRKLESSSFIYENYFDLII
jgi:hypothetical protein